LNYVFNYYSVQLNYSNFKFNASSSSYLFGDTDYYILSFLNGVSSYSFPGLLDIFKTSSIMLIIVSLISLISLLSSFFTS